MPTAVPPSSAKSRVKVPPKNPKVVKQLLEKRPYLPSEYLKIAKQNTEEKRDDITEIRVPRVLELLDIRDQGNQLNCGVPLDEPIFQPFPSEIIFQKFEPCKVYEQSLQLRNNDQNARLVKVTHESSAYFTIVPPKNPGDKIAPGMACTFKIQFLPEERKDYLHELYVITDREKFTIPVRAINGRAILDLPDEVKFGVNAVRNLACKTLFVRNIGDRECRFTCKLPQPDSAFNVEPKQGSVAVGANIQFVISFCPMKNGSHVSHLQLHYDTGEDICVKLEGTSVDVNVRLDKSTVRMENTFISLTTKRSIGITNRSDLIAKFSWKIFASPEEDQKFKLSCKEELSAHEANESRSITEYAQVAEDEDEYLDKSLGQKQALMNQTFANRRSLLENEELLFSNEVFSLFPLEGEVWPNTTLDCEVLFKPSQVDNYNMYAYLEITGRETRLPIRLHGTGVGPQIELSFETLNVGNIFLGSRHFYEVVLWNKGEIDAIYSIQSLNPGPLASCFSFDQNEAFVPPGGYQAIKIELNGNLIGLIDEVFQFQVDGMRDTTPKIKIQGRIIGPTFNFNTTRLKLGQIPFGFETVAELTLQNTSFVPLHFQLEMSSDGDYPAVSASEENADFLLHSRPDTRKPHEFTITPSHGLVPAQSSSKIKVAVLPNCLYKIEKELLVYLKDIEGCQLALPVSARVVVPDLKFELPVVDMGKCFLRYPYQKMITLVNPSPIPARYEMVPQERTSRLPVLYDSPQSWGIIEGQSSVEVPMVFQVEEKGEQDMRVLFSIFGSPEITLQFILQCSGEGPVCLVEPTALDWSKVKVLEKHEKTVSLKNESLISAKFKCQMRHADSVFSTEPTNGVIEPGDTVDVIVIASPNDTFQFTDTLLIQFEESATQSVALAATGFGSTIVTEPRLEPLFDFGPHFSQHDTVQEVVVFNKGRRLQRVHFKLDNFVDASCSTRKGVKKQETNALNKPGSRSTSNDEEGCFKVAPNRLTLEPGQKETIKITAFSATERKVSQDVIATSIIGKLAGKETIMTSQLHCTFINPIVQFSAMKLLFEIEKHPSDVLKCQTQQLSFTNTSFLPLTATFHIPSELKAFTFLTQEGQIDEQNPQAQTFELDVGEERSICVNFDPAYRSDSYTRNLNEQIEITYAQHPNKDTVGLFSVVHFPNIDFETKIVHFGCVVNETEVTRKVKMTNNGPIPVTYKWSFRAHDAAGTLVTDPGIEDQTRRSLLGETIQYGDDNQKPPEDLLNHAKDSKSGSGDADIENPISLEDAEDHDSFALNEISNGQTPDVMPDSVIDLEKPQAMTSLLSHVEFDEEFMLENVEEPPQGNTGEEADEEKLDPSNDDVILSMQKEIVSEKREQEAFSKNKNDETEQRSYNQESIHISLSDLYDIHPLFGYLPPGESETVAFTFFGHVGVKAEVTALCDVQGGPEYELQLSGEASNMHYNIDKTEIDLGVILLNEVCESEVVISNTSKVELNFRCASIAQMGDTVYVGCPIVDNPTGKILAYGSHTISIRFIPGMPAKFSKSFEIQVSHFEPVKVTIKGEGIFPRFALDLPRTLPDNPDILPKLMEQAERDLLNQEPPEKPMDFDSGLIRLKTFFNRNQNLRISEYDLEDNLQSYNLLTDEDLMKPSQLEVFMEVERLILQKHTQELPKIYPVSSKPKFMGTLLPGYELDFGFVILGDIVTKSVRLINNGFCPVTLYFLRSALQGSGFLIDLDRIRGLPGAPDYEITEFRVHFDPRGSNLDLGPVQCEVPIHVHNGPSTALVLKAHVTMPDMTVSDSVLDFGQVLCSQCKIITIQFFNHKKVPCEWAVVNPKTENATVRKPENEFDWTPNRKKPGKTKKETNISLNVFEVIPNRGVLLPGQRYNVQVKFMPLLQKRYEEQLCLKISHSSQKVGIQCCGSGVELGMQFSKNFLEFGPCLPHSEGDEQEIVISNPTDYPIEIYSVEFDNTYIEEEKTLRMMKGWDRDNCILLPPRNAGDGLPKELTDFYQEYTRKMKLEEKKQAEKAASALLELTAGDDDETESRKSSTARGAHKGDEKSEKRSVKSYKSDDDNKSTADYQLDTAAAKASKRSSVVESLADGASGVAGPTVGDLSGMDVSAGVRPPNAPTTDGVSTDGCHNQINLDQTQDGSAIGTGNNASVAGDQNGDQPPKQAREKGVGELEITPVTAAIARYLNIDLSPEGKAAENRRGIAIVVYGAPESGKSTVTSVLEKNYGLCVLKIDDVIIHAMKHGDSIKAQTARDLCAAKALSDKVGDGKTPEEEAKEAEDRALSPTSRLHKELGIVPGQPMTFKQMQALRAAQKPAAPVPAGKAGAKGGPQPAAPVEPPQPETLPAFPMPRKLGELENGDPSNPEGYQSCHLPEDLLVDLLSERLQGRDCFKGVVFDGLESLFTPSILTSAQVLLKAINNRKFIYFVETSLTQAYLKERAEDMEKRKMEVEEERNQAEQKRIEEMSEDEFEALTPHEKAEVERLQLKFKREKIKRLEEEKEKLREEEEQKRLEQLARLEAERQAKKKRKADASKSSHNPTGDKSKSQNSISQTPNAGATTAPGGAKGSQAAESSGAGTDRGGDGKKRGAASQMAVQPPIEEETPVVKLTEEEIIQNTRFKFYEMFKNDLYKMLERWDRTKGHVGRPLTPADEDDAAAGNARNQKRQKPVQADEEANEENSSKASHFGKNVGSRQNSSLKRATAPPTKASAQLSKSRRGPAVNAQGGARRRGGARGEAADKDDESKLNMENLGIPLVQLNVASPDVNLETFVFDARILPSYEELHEGLGLGITGPPIPPPATFSVVPYPVKRKPHMGVEPGLHFAFIAASLDDPNLVAEREMLAKKKEEEQREKEEAAKKGKKEKEVSREKDSKSSRGGAGSTSKEKGSRSKKISSTEEDKAGKKSNKPSAEPVEPVVPSLIQESDSALPKLNILRWVIGPHGERTLRLRFVSPSAGQFDQTLNFELVGTKRRYQLHLRGIACFPAISKEPRVLFPNYKKVLGKKEIAKKCYVGTIDSFDFGPLLLNKKRDEKETMYPENMEKFCFYNDSLLDVELSLSFLNDTIETTFMMDQTSMKLSVGERKELKVWAYPKTLGDINDVIVCCIKDNPEPVLIKICCSGCKPQLEIPKIDGKVAFQFDKVLLHRKDTKTLPFRNKTKVPAAWKIIGMDSLRDDVTLSAEQGVVPPLDEVLITAVFKATKAGPLPKKPVKMEVTDVDKIMGVVQTEQVVTSGEAYDVLMDLIFPKGPEGGIDFGTCRVGDENIRQTLSLKNKGKYEIQYQFSFEQKGMTGGEDPTKYFSITPGLEGSLMPSDRPTNITLSFFTKKEFEVKSAPIIQCKIVEPSQGETGELIAIIPIKVSARAIFSKFKISPSHDLNFGSICSGTRKQKFFTIENLGEFDFKYNITRPVSKDEQLFLEKRSKKAAKADTARSREPSVSSKATLNPKGGKKADASHAAGQAAGQFKLSMDCFSLSPAFGFVLPGTQQTIQVEAIGDITGHFEEELMLDISDREVTPKTKNGVPFKLISDVCNPIIETSNLQTIFEEHVVCKNLRNYQPTSQNSFSGVFGEAENKFVFSNVVVGEKAKARFKIVNPSKVACEVLFSIKSVVHSKVSKQQQAEVFEVSPQRASIPPHGHVYALLSFTPPTMHSYSTAFEAMVDGVAQFTPYNYFTFDVTGEATLPRLSVLKPTVQNNRGHPILLYKKLLLGHAQTMPLVLKNEGELVCKAVIDIEDPEGVFSVEPDENVRLLEPDITLDIDEDSLEQINLPSDPGSLEESGSAEGSPGLSGSKPSHKFQFEVQYKESCTFWVTFVPKDVDRYFGNVKVIVDRNQFEETEIVLLGEGYTDFISIDNVHGGLSSVSIDEQLMGTIVDDLEVKAPKSNHLNFGDVYLNEPRQMSFTLTNHSKEDYIKFEFPPDHAHLTFSPGSGHLRPCCAKDVVVIFKSATPVEVKMDEVICGVKVIKLLDSRAEQDQDWDDSKKTMQWIDIRREKTTGGAPSADLLEADRKDPSVVSRRKIGSGVSNPGAEPIEGVLVTDTSQHHIPAPDIGKQTHARLFSAASSDKSLTSKESHQQGVSPKPKSGSQRSSASTPAPPFKRKVFQIEPEPRHEVVEGSNRDVEIYYSAISDYCKFELKSENGTDIHFKDTLMFQSRVYEFRIENTSKINFDYQWQAVSESNLKSVSFAKELFEEFAFSAEGEPQFSKTRRGHRGSQSTSIQAWTTPVMSSMEANQRVQSASSGSSTVTSLRVSVMPESAADMTAAIPAVKSVAGNESPLLDAELVPFVVEPDRGVIKAGLSQSFKVKFCPLDVKEFNARLICRIPNLEEGAMGPVVAVHGKSLLPYVHFELEESDYLSSNRRSHLGDNLFTLFDGNMDPNTRVMEFESCGVNRTIKRTFRIINPTKNPFFFSWKQAVFETDISSSNEFRCPKKSGQILAGKSVDAIFEFRAKKLGSFETFWKFQIPKLGIEVPFLLVGHSREPAVTLDRTHINFKSLLIGSCGHDTVYVVNNENETLKMSVDESSLIEPDTGESVAFTPKIASLPPKSRTAINIKFKARLEKVIGFNSLINVQFKSMPLKINIKADGYRMDSLLFIHEAGNESIQLTHSKVNEIDFGEVEVNDKILKTFSISNHGRYLFEYNWSIVQPQVPGGLSGGGANSPPLTIEPYSGTLEPGESASCIACWNPKLKYPLAGSSFNLNVKHGPKYRIDLVGRSVKPSVKFSFKKYGFGYTFLSKNGQPVKHCNLTITNNDCKTISVDCLYENRPHLKVDSPAGMLEPDASCVVPFMFAPSKCVKYSETVKFLINGLTQIDVLVTGHGCELKLDVTGTKNKVCNFGAIRIGQVSKKRVHIVNHSLASATFSLFTNFTDPTLADPGTVVLWPEKEITLAPRNGTVDIELKFHPKCRVSQFLEEVIMEVEGVPSGPLFAVSGCCQATEVVLDCETIPFGAVTLNSSSNRKLVMTNTGDIGASFQWNAQKFGPDFSIYPQEGYISPGMEIVFDVNFHPQAVNQEIRYDNLICYIEHYRPLKLCLTGMCVGSAPVRETLHYTAAVRGSDKKTISVANRSYANWSLKPVIDGEQWHGADTFNVEAGHTKNYELVYKPLTMTVLDGKKHTGSLFFPMPDGSGLLYNLSGTADHPKQNGNINREIPCKTQYTEVLKVHNWLQMQQRFKAYIEMIKPEKLDNTTTLTGLDYVEVPAMTSVDYKLNFYAYREGVYSAKVVLMNEKSREYQFYLLTFKSVSPGVLQTIDLSSTVRRIKSHVIKVPNPLANPVTATVTTNIQELTVASPVALPPESEGSVNVEFLPLKEGETTARVQLQCNELGLFVYEFRLEALAANFERPIFFRTTLGSSHTMTAKIVNFYKSKTDFSCQISSMDGSSCSGDFSVEKSINAVAGGASGSEIPVDVSYEPSAIGDFKALLEISSPNAGDFKIPLFASCGPPKPQGPYVIKANSSTSILFKNIFNQPVSFVMTTDNKCFSIKESDNTIRGKKSHNIMVTYEGNPDGNKNPKMGKLTVYCPRELVNGENISWVYLLKGITPQ